MARKALIIGGSGQIGRAVASRLMDQGWRVIAGQRRPFDALPGLETILVDREEKGSLARAVGCGVDALIDTVAYDEGHARQLLEIQGDVGAFVVISSGSVYRDADGRTLDEAAETGFPSSPDRSARTSRRRFPAPKPTRRARSHWNRPCCTARPGRRPSCAPGPFTASGRPTPANGSS